MYRFFHAYCCPLFLFFSFLQGTNVHSIFASWSLSHDWNASNEAQERLKFDEGDVQSYS
jgi:hypothetical protein